MKKYLYYILLFSVVLVATLLSFFGKTDTSIIFMSGSFAMIFLGNLEKLEFFKFYGVEARIKATINEANATIEQLKSLSKALAEPAISLIASSVIPNPMPLSYRLSLISRINEILQSLQIPPEEIQRINGVSGNVLRVLHISRITAGIDNIPPDLLITSGQFSSPGAYEEFLNSRKLLTPERQELIKDLQYFIESGKFRRPELWEDQ